MAGASSATVLHRMGKAMGTCVRDESLHEELAEKEEEIQEMKEKLPSDDSVLAMRVKVPENRKVSPRSLR